MKQTLRKKVVLLVAAAIICAAGIWVLALTFGVSTADAAKLKTGMSMAQVEAMLGAAVRDPTRHRGWTFYRLERFDATDGYIHVGFDVELRVATVSAERVPILEKHYDKLLRKLGLRIDPFQY